MLIVTEPVDQILQKMCARNIFIRIGDQGGFDFHEDFRKFCKSMIDEKEKLGIKRMDFTEFISDCLLNYLKSVNTQDLNNFTSTIRGKLELFRRREDVLP